jgi:hypothetical protein
MERYRRKIIPLPDYRSFGLDPTNESSLTNLSKKREELAARDVSPYSRSLKDLYASAPFEFQRKQLQRTADVPTAGHVFHYCPETFNVPLTRGSDEIACERKITGGYDAFNRKRDPQACALSHPTRTYRGRKQVEFLNATADAFAKTQSVSARRIGGVN